MFTGRAPLISSALNNAGLKPRPSRCSKNSSINASTPDTAPADMLVPDS